MAVAYSWYTSDKEAFAILVLLQNPLSYEE